MNTSLPEPPPVELKFYAEGEIASRLQQIASQPSAPSREQLAAEAYREAAAVLTAFHPGKLQPARPLKEEEDEKGGVVLLPELIPSSVVEQNAGFPWSLAADERKKTLGRMKTQAALKNALQANPERPDTLLQQMFARVIDGEKFKTDRSTSAELTALVTLSQWLEETDLITRLPAFQELNNTLQRRRDRENLERLTGGVFTGREKETATIKEHLDSLEPRILWVSAAGGTGKSALLAHTLLSWTDWSAESRRTWVRIDLDHSQVRPDQPLTLLAESVGQLTRTIPDIQSHLLDFKARAENVNQHRQSFVQRFDSSMPSLSSHGLESAFDVGEESEYLEREFGTIVRFLTDEPEERFALWIDTFEEAQFLGESVVITLLEMLEKLVRNHPGLRVIISGRAKPLGDHLKEIPVKLIRLRNLPSKAAGSLLSKLVVRHRRTDLPKRVIQDAVRQMGGNPLTLHLAAPLLSKAGELDKQTLENVEEKTLQAQLYSRILEHIHDSDVRALAMPGLVVRRITPGIISEVLAEPCGLVPEGDKDQWSQRLFQEFAREISLVETDSDGSLLHRQDVRKLMLAAMPRRLEKIIVQIDRRAVEYWSREDSVQARAEKLYHMLRLERPEAELEAAWVETSGPLLRSVLDEFPKQAKPRLWLASKLQAVLEARETVDAPQPVWERQTATAVQRHLLANKPQLALKALGARSQRLPGSPLFGMEARALMFTSKGEMARKVAVEGIAASRQKFKRVAADLSILLSLIEERLGNKGPATTAILEARKLAEESDDLPLRLTADLRWMRLSRLYNVPSNRSDKGAVMALVRELGQDNLWREPALLREVAAELGSEDPTFLRGACDRLLEEVLLPKAPDEIVALLTSLEVSGSTEEADSLRHTEKNHLIKIVKIRLVERLYDTATLPPELIDTVTGLFRESVESILTRDYPPSSDSKPKAETLTARITSAALKKEPLQRAKRMVSEYLEHLSQDAVERIARRGANMDLQFSWQKSTSTDLAHQLIDTASKLELMPQLLGQIEQAVSIQKPSTDLHELHELQNEIAYESGHNMEG